MNNCIKNKTIIFATAIIFASIIIAAAPLSKSRQENFPLPLGPKGSKGRWLASDIERYVEGQSNTVPSVAVSSTRQQRREAKDFEQRQSASKRVLEKHAVGRKVK